MRLEGSCLRAIRKCWCGSDVDLSPHMRLVAGIPAGLPKQVVNRDAGVGFGRLWKWVQLRDPLGKHFNMEAIGLSAWTGRRQGATWDLTRAHFKSRATRDSPRTVLASSSMSDS